MAWSNLLLLQCGDVEANPGPPRARREAKPDKQKVMEERMDAFESRLTSLEEMLEAKLGELRLDVDKTRKESEVEMSRRMQGLEVLLKETVEGLEENSRQMVHKCAEQSREHSSSIEMSTKQALASLSSQMSSLQSQLEHGLESLSLQQEAQNSKLTHLEQEVEDVQEKLWHMDKSWKNNLLVYGLKEGSNDNEDMLEQKIRDVIKNRLQISREMSIARVRRSANGPEVRGSRPVTVSFEKYSDKEEVLRKANLLKNSSIYFSEDFSKKVRDQRQELQKFMRQLRLRRPESKFHLQFDRLLVDNDVFVFNENSGKVEQLNLGSVYDEINRSKSSGRQRNHQDHFNGPGSPQKSRSASPTKSPTKSAPKHRQQHDDFYTNNDHQNKNDDKYQNTKTNNNNYDDYEEEINDQDQDNNRNQGYSPVRRLSTAAIPETIPE